MNQYWWGNISKAAKKCIFCLLHLPNMQFRKTCLHCSRTLQIAQWTIQGLGMDFIQLSHLMDISMS